MSFELTPKEKQILLKTAREAISARLEKRRPRYPEPTEILKKKCGAFVTLHEHGSLRGCIGFVIPSKPLIETVAETAQSSAFNDPRFPPLTEGELKDIEIEISVLSPLRRIESVGEIEVGVHGIMLRSGFRSGLLLPQVATEYGWDRDTFLTHTCYKAGLPGDCWRAADTEIEVFSAVVFGEHSP
ncbi:MAG: AmmeMemoRadiSam system protein A [Spirochaetales bacterium]|nr:AmmeMemoRadiSam system protein A [Spirochaetales bacterium]